ncbi:copper resistance protein CopC [Actinoplanes sp. TRM 88003]|uniref:Copper resistance protein CopC n=1 Tax=Paractinoplanes aksuensis TaxID=2939490 RepID=A0ABT1DEM8_9ACTN|nr:copper resistance protein CopC [Actinoplanes aksuensis]MCO8269272.1 copper resistance protein CopC [Actinoplanes aksuensis]
MRRVLITLAAILAVLAPPAPAWAHAKLLSADPAQSATLAKAPTSVTLTFNEELNPDFTTVVLSDAAQQRLPLAVPAVEATKARVAIDQPIGNGTYLLAYRVVSQDGHTVQGSYTFTVADPALPPAAVVAAPSAAAAPPAGSGRIPTGVLIGLGALGIFLAAVAAYFFASGRRRRGSPGPSPAPATPTGSPSADPR